MKKIALLLALVLLPVTAFGGWYYGPSEAVEPGAFPSTGILDNFNRGNNPVGANWYVYEGTLTVDNNRVRGNTAGDYSSGVWVASIDPGWTDCEVFAQILTGYYYSLDWRVSENGAYTAVIVRNDGAGNDVINIYKFSATYPEGELIGATIVQEIAPGDGVGIRMVGTLIEVFYWNQTSWSKIAERTDSHITGPGAIGLGTRLTTYYMDNFGGGSLD